MNGDAGCGHHWCSSTGNAVREDALLHVVAARGRSLKREARCQVVDGGVDNHHRDWCGPRAMPPLTLSGLVHCNYTLVRGPGRALSPLAHCRWDQSYD